MWSILYLLNYKKYLDYRLSLSKAKQHVFDNLLLYVYTEYWKKKNAKFFLALANHRMIVVSKFY
jgi:hypothetical protein